VRHSVDSVDFVGMGAFKILSLKTPRRWASSRTESGYFEGQKFFISLGRRYSTSKVGLCGPLFCLFPYEKKTFPMTKADSDAFVLLLPSLKPKRSK
jgi:hypothetical protein